MQYVGWIRESANGTISWAVQDNENRVLHVMHSSRKRVYKHIWDNHRQLPSPWEKTEYQSNNFDEVCNPLKVLALVG